jgi:sulfur-carrier protein adenylyltransferase/sulfurtransferase
VTPSDPLDAFSPEELHRYARHLSLGEVGVEGQRRLKEARVLVVGAGGLGSPAALYLAAAGVGTLGIIDPDRVELSNLQRQVLHATASVGRLKVDSARERVAEANPHVRVETHPVRLTAENALEVVSAYDLVVDGSDNFATRYLVNDAAFLTGRPWVYGAILRWEGQASLFGAPDGPCYRCLFREPPPPGLVPGCAEAGVIGALPGVVGSIQALEAVKWILGVGESAAGRLLVMDLLRFNFRMVHPRRDPDCPLCGETPSLRELVDYDWFCATGETRPVGAVGEVTPEPPATITPQALARWLSGGGGEPEGAAGGALNGEGLPLLLDVREDWEWAVSSLAALGAIHLPLGGLEEGAGGLPRDRAIVVYCRSGVRSARAVDVLRAAGWARVCNLEGGLEGWAREIDPALRVA